MYLEYFGLNEAPFRITPHTDFFFSGANRGATLDALLYAITHDEGIVKVSGEVGSGKTMLCRVLMERLPENVKTIHLANPSLSREEILFTLADELQVNLATNRVGAVMRALQEHLIDHYAQGHRVVVLIDEAHAMPAETLEEIRLLSNLESNRHKLLQIVLFGQPELNEVLNRTEMRQLKERITHNFALEPLVHTDVAPYIQFRMRAAGYRGPDVFSKAALKLIASASLGLTRRINILCDKALLAAFAEGTHQITPAHVRAAIRDADFRQTPGDRRAAWWLGSLAALALLLVAAALIYNRSLPAAREAARPSTPIEAPAARGATPVAPATREPTASAPNTDSPTPGAPQNDAPAPLAAPAAANATAPASAPDTPAEQHAENSPTADSEHSRPAQEAPPARSDSWGPVIGARLDATRQWLAATPEDHWFIQLLSSDAGNVRQIEKFIEDLARSLEEPDAIRVYTVVVRETPRLGVIYGDYASREAALQALAHLPPGIKTYKPYPRRVRNLKD